MQLSFTYLSLLVIIHQASNGWAFTVNPNRGLTSLKDRVGKHASKRRTISSSCCSTRGLNRINTNRNLMIRNMSSGGGNFLSSRRGFLSNILKAFLIIPFVEIITRIRARLIDLDAIQYPEGTEKTTIVFHGSGGTDTNTDSLMSKLGSKGFMVNWYQYSKSTLFAAWNGQRVGKEVAKRLSLSFDKNQKQEIHIIGISVGGMAADACVVELKKQMPNVYVQETLLDPLCARGIWDWTYGERTFGRDANYAQQYLNTDDPVPFTNTPLKRNCAVYDVTPVRPQEIFGHDWPLIYYTDKSKLDIVSENDQLSRGEIITIES